MIKYFTCAMGEEVRINDALSQRGGSTDDIISICWMPVENSESNGYWVIWYKE